MKLVTKITTLTLSSVTFLSILFTSNSSALTYSSNVDVGFTFNPTISINLSGDLLVNNLISGGAALDSNTIDVAVSTNATEGYTLTATAGTSTSNTDLINQTNSSYRFTSIATNASLASLTTDNTWGFSYSSDNGTNWSNYSGLPLDNNDEGVTGKQLYSTINPSDSKTIKFKIGAKASNSQPAGLYSNIINFYAVANPDPTLQPVSCPAGKICYNANSLTPVVGEMGQQSASNGASTTLWASNFSREGYGFAGWSDAVNSNGIKYGPNQTITTPSDIETNGYSLYAIWVKSAGNMQGWTGCSNLSQGEVTARTDTRDNNTYAIAKLADGKCWMIENLRLDNTAQQNTSGSLAQGYNSSFIGLATPESANFSSSTTANSLYSTDGTTDATISGSNQDRRFPRYNNINTQSRQSSSGYSANGNTYSIGNYYTWHAAIADTTHYSTYNQSITSTSLCPASWRLPRGGNKSNEANNEFWNLIVTNLNNGINPANYDSSTYPYYTGTAEGAPISNTLRSYPNNFLYSGEISGSTIYDRGSYGYLWSSTARDLNDSYTLFLSRTGVYPGTNFSTKYYGHTIRCMLGS